MRANTVPAEERAHYWRDKGDPEMALHYAQRALIVYRYRQQALGADVGERIAALLTFCREMREQLPAREAAR